MGHKIKTKTWPNLWPYRPGFHPIFEGKEFQLDELVSHIEDASVEEIFEMKQIILSLFYQMTRIYDDDELQSFGKKLFNILDKKLMSRPQNVEALTKLQGQFERGETKLKVSPIYQKQKEEYAKKKKVLTFLMDKVSSLLSEKTSSSKAMTHKQLKRFNAIKSNTNS